jgi:5'-3' exonuclease
LIDGSYFVFYRVFALLVWWKNAKPEIELVEPFKNEEFVAKFRSTFIGKIKEIIKNLDIKNVKKVIIGKDCPQSQIWRMSLHNEYKSGRNQTKNKESNIADFFKLTYAENLFIQAGADYIFEYNSLEADDCIALTTKYLLQKAENKIEIFIITSDQDYLQLACNEVKLYNLKYKLLTDSKNCKNDPQKDLFFKIVGGDKSDNISPIFKKCGPKTIEKCYDDKDFFHNKLEKEKADGSLDKYELNKLLVDFNNIPKHLCEGFINNISNKI